MKLTTLLSLSAMATSALAQTLTVPVDLADGAYLISMDAEGNQITTELGNITSTSTDSVVNNKLGKRAYNWPSGTYPVCPGGNWFLQGDFYNHAFNTFWDICFSYRNVQVPARTVLVSKQGNAMAYMCAFSANTCSTDEWGNAVDWVAGNCKARSNGYMEPGYLEVPTWQKRYGYAATDAIVC